MDIDIDFADRNDALKLLDHIPASRLDQNRSVKHNTGIYFHRVPVNAENALCDTAYEQAEDLGYFKIDFLNVSIYKDVKNEDHLIELMNREPLWDLLEQEEFVNMLFHVNGHSDICQQMKPRTVEELAAVLAVIRPAKRHLLGKPWEEVLENVWAKPVNGEYYFKKSHSIAYAMAIVVQMNLICEQLSTKN
jgi:DNA polymerase III alpha subunit